MQMLVCVLIWGVVGVIGGRLNCKERCCENIRR